MKFLKTVSLDEASDLLDHSARLPRQVEFVAPEDALGRYLFEDIVATEYVPYYNRSTVDGYAVISGSTQGASDSVPVVLKGQGAVQIGQLVDQVLTPESTMYVPTGGMVPPGADAMVMVEDTQTLDDLILIQRPAVAGANLILKGEDVAPGQTVLPQGKRLKAQDIGILVGLNILKIPVYQQPGVFIISTGDEFADPCQLLGDGKIRDINTYTIGALAKEAGFAVNGTLLVRDDLVAIQEAIRRGLECSDLVLLSGGSSAGERDYTKLAIEQLGGEILFHGIRLKPGKPTIGAQIGQTPVIGLPGHPVSAMMVFQTVVLDYFRKNTGCRFQPRKIKAKTTVNFPSVPGRVTCQFLTLTETPTEILCQPYYSNSALISQLTNAEGYTMIAEETEGLDKGTIVDVILL
ncbi:MAG: molybdopterin molybdotransferase MoeA [Clostridiaceae bacterium]